MWRQGNGVAFGIRTLWLAAAVLAAPWAPDVQAYDAGRSSQATVRLAQTMTDTPPESHAGEAQDHQNAEVLARELAAARRDLELLLKLLNKARDEQARAKQAADREAAELRKALQEERDRASKLQQDLATARRDVETQTALAAKAGDEASQLKKTADAGTADLQKSLQQERDRASRLEQDLATVRRDVETQTALAAKAGADASQLKKTTDAGTADLQKSLQLERERASKLEQDLATARVARATGRRWLPKPVRKQAN
jgi:hypothetical protein